MAELPLQELELGGYWTQQPYMMVSARGMIAEKTWIKHIGKSGRIWLQPHGETENSMIIVDGGRGSQGFGGGMHKFTLHTGEVIELEGPWSSNHDAFFVETGIDLRDRYRSWGCIGRHRGDYPSKYDSRSVICDLLYWDPPEGIVGSFNRIRDMVAKMALERDEVLYAFSGTDGGSSCGPTYPFEGSDEYKLYRRDIHQWRKQFKRKDDIGYWAKLQEPYWARYQAEFTSDLELASRGIYAKPLQTVPLDEELELNPPPPPPKKEPIPFDDDWGDYY